MLRASGPQARASGEPMIEARNLEDAHTEEQARYRTSAGGQRLLTVNTPIAWETQVKNHGSLEPGCR